jgi:mono/diheme cytochrome c family protein
MAMRTALVGLGVSFLLAALALPEASRAQDAKQLFVDGKCIRCHSIEAQDVAAKPKEGKEDDVKDLSNVGSEQDAEWIRQFLRKEVKLDGKKHKQKYRGSDEDLKTLALWLASLK